MMTKSKHKQPPKNFFRYFVDEYILFRRDFVIETTASVEVCIYQLVELSREKDEHSNSRTTAVSIMPLSPTTSSFKIHYAEPEDSYGQGISVEGSIERDDDGMTLITGRVLLFGWGYWLWIVFILLLVAIHMNNITDLRGMLGLLCISTLPLGWISFLWSRMFAVRKQLLLRIEQTIRYAEMESNLSKAKNEQFSQPLDASSEHQTQRKGEP
jgi:hypothetical protein